MINNDAIHRWEHPTVGPVRMAKPPVRFSSTGHKPVWDGQAFVPRKMLPLALSYDHRVINGGDGGRFMSRLVELLADIRQLAM